MMAEPGAPALPAGGPGGPSAGEVHAMEHWGPALLALVVGAFMALLDSSIVNVAIPTMEHVFGVNTSQVEWVVTIYLLALGVVVPASGWLGDRLGYKRLYLLSLLVFTIGSGLSALSWSLPVLIGARVIQALGGGMIMPTTMSMVFRLIPRRNLGVATGFFGMSMLLAPALGPTIGGYLVQYTNWRWIFTINLPVGVFGLLLASAVLPEFAEHEPGRFDLWGFLTSASGLFALLLALSEGQTWGWQSPGIIWLLYGAGVALLAFVWIELAVDRPLLDLRTLGYKSFLASLIFAVGVNIALFAGAFFIPVFLQLVRGLTPLSTGLILMPGALATGIMMPVAGRMYDRIGPVVPVLLGTVLLTLGNYLLRDMSLQTPRMMIVWWMVVRGLGMGLAMMPATTAGMSVIPPRQVGRASALNNIVMRIAGSFGIAVLTVLLNDGTATQSARLAQSFVPGTPAAAQLQSLTAHAGSAGAATILSELAGYVSAQGFTLELDHLFVLLSGVGLITVVPALFLRKGMYGGQGAGAPVD